MSAVATKMRAGDVVEIDLGGDAVSALVLLATHEFVILDPCDGRTPVVVSTAELGPVRVFHGPN